MKRTLARSVSLALVVAASLSAALSPRAIEAQGVSRIEASVRAAQARAAIRRGDDSEAVRLFRESIAMNPAPDTLRDLAMIYERRNERRLASELWIRLSVTARSPAERASAAERAELLRRAPSMLRVWVQPMDAARRARVWFDRDAPRVVPVGGAEAVVEGGTHRVRVESPGYLPFEVMVPTAFGEAREVVARLARVPDPALAGADAGAGTSADAGAGAGARD